MRIHQLLPVFGADDAMGQAAVAFRQALRRAGVWGEIYAGERSRGSESHIRSAHELAPAIDDVVLYHHGIASPWAAWLLHAPCLRGVVFHNITPPFYYAGQRLEEVLRASRAQLGALAPHVTLAIGVSAFNVSELLAAGFKRVFQVPLPVEPARFVAKQADEGFGQRLRALGAPLLLSVGRAVPHKRLDDVVALHAQMRRLVPRAQLLLAGPMAEGHASTIHLRRRAAEVGGVHFLGRLSHSQLVAAYRAADAYVSMSEHEGVGVPLLEAMAAELPVYAFGAAAVPETMGGAGITFDEKNFAALAEVITTVQSRPGLRAAVIEGQTRRAQQQSMQATAECLQRALASVRPRRVVPRRERPRVTFVVQRYGEDLVGGAEGHARQVVRALHSTGLVELEVLTTCARDHLSWANEIAPGRSEVDGVSVERFPVVRPRALASFNRLSREVFGRGTSLPAEERWLAEQGPLVPDLLESLSQSTADVVVFFTYLYAPTAWGVPLVAKKALVVPTAHPEPPMAFEIFRDVFELPHALLCNTPEEAALIRRRFPRAAPTSIVGVGVEVPAFDGPTVREQLGLPQRYLAYVGRLESGKQVDTLLAHHAALRARYHDAPTLVLCGAGPLGQNAAGVRFFGRVSEDEKWAILQGALATVVPSSLESLSLLALESQAVGTPVLANAASEVLAGQLGRSGGGLLYSDVESFVAGVRTVGLQRTSLGEKGRAWASQHGWAPVTKAWLSAINRVWKGET
jgi:glycosyltransferase involved in cell wall biosynthesis